MLEPTSKLFKAVVLFSIVLIFILLTQKELITNEIYKSLTVAGPDKSVKKLNLSHSSVINNTVLEKWRHRLDGTQYNSLSKLGRILYLEDDFPHVNTSLRTYVILIWKYGPLLERRHIKHYTDSRFDPFENCSVKNCLISYKEEDLPIADLVLFHLHQTRNAQELPKRGDNFQQLWTFLTDESPYHTFLNSRNNNLPMYNGLFNWSMNYRMDSDIPVPYGRTVTLKTGENRGLQTLKEWNESKHQDIIVAVMGSNCGGHNHRWKYIKELQEYIAIDIYGGCGKLKCPGHFTRDCKELLNYKFYLAFENSNCDEYITEKLWWNGYAKNAIPVVMGSTKNTYRQLLPPNSYINVEDFDSPKNLSNYLIYLNQTPNELEKYFEWKKNFKVLNEHGYFQSSSVHYCRICEALNYNNKNTRIYNDLKKFWSTSSNCYTGWDEKNVLI